MSLRLAWCVNVGDECKHHADLKCPVTEQGEAVWPVTGCDASVASAPGGPHWPANPTGHPAQPLLLSARTGLGQVAGQVIFEGKKAHQCCHHRGCNEEWQMRPGRPQVTSTKLLLLLETYDSVT